MKFDVVLIHPLKRGEVRGTMVRRSVELSATDGDTLERSLCELASQEVASRRFTGFRCVGVYPTQRGTAVRTYGFQRGKGRPNSHERLAQIDGLVFGPVVVVHTNGADDLTACALTCRDYDAIRECAFGEESVGNSDSERSEDSSAGDDMGDFIVGDDVFD